MKLFDHTADRLATRTALLLTADPGDALLDAARLYDPKARSWHGRLVFSNGVLVETAFSSESRHPRRLAEVTDYEATGELLLLTES